MSESTPIVEISSEFITFRGIAFEVVKFSNNTMQVWDDGRCVIEDTNSYYINHTPAQIMEVLDDAECFDYLPKTAE